MNEASHREEPNVSRETHQVCSDAEHPDEYAAPRATVPPSTTKPKSDPAETPSRNKRSSVYTYLAVLFGAAFLMLLLAYFVQQRNNESTISGLQNSWNLSREELMQENDWLEEENKSLTAQITELEEDLQFERDAGYEFQVLYDGARNQASHLEHFMLQRTQAMELYWQLEKAYAQEMIEQCRQLIEWLETPEANPLKNYLPDSDDRSQYDYSLDSPTPAERYQEICEQLS